MSTKTSSKTPAKKSNGATKTPSTRNLKSATGKCLCGCGQSVPRRFLQGHDAQLHGKVLEAHKAEKTVRVGKTTYEYLRTAPWMTPAVLRSVKSA